MRANYREIPQLVRNMVPFTGNTMSAVINSSGEYWIFSYSTPIAVIDPSKDIFKLNANKYSTTTSRQQNIIRRAFPQLVEVPSAKDL